MTTTTIDSQVQRKLIEILRILFENKDPIGARLIADRMNERGYPIGERGVRYHCAPSKLEDVDAGALFCCIEKMQI